MTEVFLAVKAMQGEQVACQYFIPAGEYVQSFAGLWCSMFPWAQGLLPKDLTSAVQGVHLMVTETWAHRNEFKLLLSARFLRRQQWHQVWDCSH